MDGEFPSRAHQFPRQKNPNTKGRPAGKSITTILREVGDRAAKLDDAKAGKALKALVAQLNEGRDPAEKLTNNELAALRLWAIGLHEPEAYPAMAALRTILDRSEGKVAQPIKNDDGPLEIRVVYADAPPGDPEAAPGPGDDPPEDEAL